LGVSVAIVLTSIWLQTSNIIRWYIRAHYDGVDPRGSIHIDWAGQKLVLTNVTVKRPYLFATLDKVLIDRNRSVMILGGHLSVALGSSTKTTPSRAPKHSIIASGLEVIVTRGDVKADLSETTINGSEICFRKGLVSHPRATVTIQSGCVRRDLTRATAKAISLPIERVPTWVLLGGGKALFEAVDVELVRESKSLKAQGSTFGPVRTKEVEVRFEGGVITTTAQDAVVDHPWVSAKATRFAKVGIQYHLPGELGGGPKQVQLQLNEAHFSIDPQAQSIEGRETCATWVDALPEPLPEPLVKVSTHLTGDLHFTVSVKPETSLQIVSSCKFQCSAPPIKGLVGQRFTHTVYDKDNKLIERASGPGTKGWTPLSLLPEYVPEAFRLMEDPGFHHHHGLHVKALENSLKANLEKGSFVKGGSTITMQLAKNLWLRRHKTINRKAQEAFLALILESCLSKAQIMELYVNVVEYGPNLYGLGPASKHYFHKHPANLTPDEAFYLAGLLPNPRKALPPYSGGLLRAQRRMKRLATSGYIQEHLAVDDETLADTETSDWILATD